MKLKLLTSLAGPTMALAPGDTYEPADDEALRMIDAGFAEATDAKAEAAARKAAAAQVVTDPAVEAETEAKA